MTLLLPGGVDAQGSLRQEEISLTLRDGPLVIRITPLAPPVMEVTAPDTRGRLEAMAREYGQPLRQRWGSGVLFLVTVFSLAPDTPFQPHEVVLEARGFTHRSLGVAPVTPGWSQERVGQQETAMGVYLFPTEVDAMEQWDARYRGAATQGEWRGILARVMAERGRLPRE